ncbi:MAG: bifunctional phosphopantothenoylcysteine decarboxylase/phosphopantothenate--cysteine ligase CoaBC [Clostridiaceae bacterium]|nr:bifunctional phosphopantothenoylcysteine decarboxylase/phosphopantothenate--cysteine ligase CoaBC [Clostridiaceae bacterium]
MSKLKTVVLGVTGGIAAYKALDIVSKLKKVGIDVHVIMTESATEFINPISFQSLSQNLVASDMFSEPKAWEIQHISLAKKADLVLVAPATANLIGKVANGIADDMLSTTIMATKAKVIFAPAMNTNMYQNPIVQHNISKLKEFGYVFLSPSSGRLACGDVGEGKLEDTEIIVSRVLTLLYDIKDMVGKNVIVTAGPTLTPIDPVRYISNYSSGKMGYAIAEEARDRGANVTLISGPSMLKVPQGVKFISVSTSEEMLSNIEAIYEDTDIVIKAAAVSDYKIKEYSNEKIKKSETEIDFKFEKNIDILKYLGGLKTHQILVGFAAESNNILNNAKEKLEVKNLDYIVANDITKADTGFSSDDNKVTILCKDGRTIELKKMAKRQVAKELFDLINIVIN